jgi:gliding motility-associated-like protein
MKYLVIVFLLLFSFMSKAQLDLGDDIVVNAGTSVQLNARFAGTYATMIEAWDDAFEGKFPIGFPFTFYGELYDSVSLSPNGVLSFDDHPATYYLQMLPIPNAVFTKSVMGPYQDLFTRPMSSPHTKNMYYGIVGDAPNRKFVAGWCEAPMYECEDQLVSLQIVLEEGTDEIYNHIFHKAECVANQGNRATQGLNYDLTKGIAVAGRNNESWSADKETWHFVPSNVDNYYVENIDFAPDWVFPEHSISFRWYENSISESNFLSDQWSISVSPEVSTTYYGVMKVCGGVEFIDEVLVQVIPVPTAFNPNSNIEENRTFGLHFEHPEDVDVFDFQIYNRWGALMFKTSDPLDFWNGKSNAIDCPTDVYTWVVRYRLYDKTVQNSGTITLVR